MRVPLSRPAYSEEKRCFRMELRKAVALFLGEHKATTVQAYHTPLEMMRDWCGPARQLSDIKPEMLVEYFQVVVYPHGYSPATVQKHVKTIKTFWNWVVNLELVEKSPARAVKGKKLPGAVDRSKAMTDAELAAILSVLRYKPRDYALLMFLADTGCRRGGACGLRLADLDFKALEAEVTEKGDLSRKVTFGEACAEALGRWLAYRGDHHVIKGVFIFSRDGLPIQAETISIIIRRAARVAGIRVLSSHSLRHRKGHQFADARIAPSIAATALGHSDPIVTMTYYYPRDWESAKRALQELVTDPDTLLDAPPNVVKFKG